MTLRHILVSCALLAAAPTWAVAQQPATPAPKPVAPQAHAPPPAAPGPPPGVKPPPDSVRAPVRRFSPPAPTPGDRPGSLLAGVELTGEQKQALRAEWRKLYPRWEAIVRRNPPGAPPSKADMVTLQEISAEHLAMVAAALDSTQRQRFDANLDKRRARERQERNERAQAAPAEGRP